MRKRALGDVLWIEPLIRQLAATTKKVIVFTKYNVLFKNYPLQNVVFKNRLSAWEKVVYQVESLLGISFRFINLDMAYEKKPKMHFLHAYQQKAGVPLTNEYPRLFLTPEEQQLKQAPSGKYMVLHLESMTDKNYRNVYGINWNEIAAYINSKGITVVQIGQSPKKIDNTVYIKTSIRELMGLLKNGLFFIGLDSGPSHIAASLGVPSLVFFGSVNPLFRHFKDFFKGYFLQQYCELANCYHDITNNITGPQCKLVGDSGIPKCSLHTDAYVKLHIDLLIKEYLEYDNKAYSKN